jgi:hypothetical protein
VYNDLRAGKKTYIDRDYVFQDPVPPRLLRQTYIRTAQADRDTTGTDFLRFDVNRDILIYVALDDRIAPPPSWLASWTRHSDQLWTNDPGAPSRNLFSRQFPKGRVTLGGNRDPNTPTGRSMYTVILVPHTTAARDWELYDAGGQP